MCAKYLPPQRTLIRLDSLSGHLGSLPGELVELLRDLGHGGVDAGLVAEEERTDDAGVDHVGAIPGHRHEAPHQEEALRRDRRDGGRGGGRGRGGGEAGAGAGALEAG